MTDHTATAEPAADTGVGDPHPVTIGLVGNPNVGKTSVFNRLTNLLAKTSNFGGTTVEHRTGLIRGSHPRQQLVDLPGLYSLQSHSPDEEVACAVLRGELADFPRPDGILIVVDATNLERSLFVAREARQLGLPMVVAVNMIELARRQGLRIDTQKLQTRLGCPVVPVSARTGEGFVELQKQLHSFVALASLPVLADEPCDSCGSCPYADGHRWAATLARESVYSGRLASHQFTDTVDRIVTQRWLGPLVFLAVMLTVFALVFWLAQFPMELLDAGFGQIGGWVSQVLPASDLRSLLTDGILAGVGGVLIFLPQICILFFALAILEDSGYLARAVMVVDGWMRRVGLPGQAFVPLLAAHACAIPAIMATKVVENRRDRLVAILVIPLMTCSARLPVYTMIAAMLFPQQAWKAAGLFAGAYFLGIVAAFVMAWVFKMSILPGKPSPLILDLPPYRAPSLQNAARQAIDRGWMFLRDAGTVILLISIAIWALSTYPKFSDESFAAQLAASPERAAAGPEQLESLRSQWAQEHSIIGRAGKWVQPVFAPLGFDWKTSVGVLTSFAAREVVVSTLSVLYGMGQDAEVHTLSSRLLSAHRADGSAAFDAATCVSLLVFFVLAMQCLPTQAVTRRETGSWKWAAFQFGYMSLLAYAAAFIARHIVLLFG